MSEKTVEGGRPGRITTLELASVGASIAALGLSRVGFNAVGNHVLGIDAVGLANLCLSLALLVGLPVSAGLAAGISRFLPLISAPDQAARALRTVVAWSVVCLVAGLAVAIVALRTWSSPLPAGQVELTVVACWASLYGIYAIGRAQLFAEGRTRLALVLELLALTSFAAGLAMASVRPALWWLPFGLYPVPMVGRLLGSLARPIPPADAPIHAGFLRFAVWAFLGSAASLGIQYSSTLVAGSHGGTGHAGVWATLASLAAPVLLLPRSLSTVFLPRLARLSAGPQEALADARAEHRRVASILAFPATALPMLLGPYLLPLVLGAGVGRETSTTWMIVCLSTYVICRKEPVITSIAARGHAGVNALSAFGGAALCIGAWVTLPPLVGQLPALALGLLLQAFSSPAIATMLVRRLEPRERPSLAPQRGDLGIALAMACSLLGREHPVFLMVGSLAVIALSLMDARRIWRVR